MAVEVFCVQTYWRAGSDRFEPGQFHQFGSRDCAMQAAKHLARSRPGVMVFKVAGEPVADIWQPPQVIARFGDAPSMPLAA